MSEETEEGVTRTKLACNHEYVQYHSDAPASKMTATKIARYESMERNMCYYRDAFLKELQNRQALEKKIADIWFFFKKVAESESDEE